LRKLAWLGLALLAVPLASMPAEDAGPEKEGSEPAARSVLRGDGLAPTLSVHGFADTTFLLQSTETDADVDSTEAGFFVGEFDLYLVGRLSQRFSFLAETVFEYETDGETRAEVERIFVKYAHSDRLWASLGRRHTPLGYWNETFHHGLILQPTVERPRALRFEDHDGILPIHSVGLDVGGTYFRGPWSLEYRGGVYNGRAPERDVVESFGDSNVNKAGLLKLSVVRESRNGQLQFGPMVLRDEIPPSQNPLSPHGEIDERIYGFHFVYTSEPFEFLSEYWDINHRETDAAAVFDHRAYYALAVWQPWVWKPYIGYDVLDLQEGDPYYVGIPPSQRRTLAGVRFDVAPFLAVKFELRHDDETGLETNGIAIQVAYTF